MNRSTTATSRRSISRRLSTAPCTALALCLVWGCASGRPSDSTGIPGFEPTIKTVQATSTERFFVLDSSDIVVASRDRSLLGIAFLMLDDAQLPYRRFFQKLPPRTAVALIVDAPRDSILMDSTMRAAKAPVTIWERFEVPRDNAGNAPPISRFLVSSVRNRVARAWVIGTDSSARPLPDWIVAGVTQLITGYPTSAARTAQLTSQRADLVPLDSLMRMRIPESAVPSGMAGAEAAGATGARPNVRRRAPANTPPRRVSADMLAALEAAGIIEFMWAREGRGIIKELVDAARRGEPLSAVIANAVSLPHDVAALEEAWKATLAPPKKE